MYKKNYKICNNMQEKIEEYTKKQNLYGYLKTKYYLCSINY